MRNRQVAFLGPGIFSRSLLWAVLVCAALTSFPFLLWLTRNTDGSEYRYWYGFLDRRWLVSLYFLWVLGLPLMTLVITRLRSNSSPPGAVSDAALMGRSANSGTDTVAEQVHRSSRWVKPAVAMSVLTLAWFLWGPPWVGASLHIPVEFHESVHLKGLQAILTGSQPFVGAANEQYGPLSQRFIAAWITGPGAESIAGIRTAYLAMNFMAIVFLVIACFAFLRTATATVVTLLVLVTSPMLAFYGFTDQGMSGFWGWANPWRYLGLLFLGLAIPWLVTKTNRPIQRSLAVLVGGVWAVTTLIAQENLVGGVVVTGVIAIVLIATNQGTKRDTIWLFICIAGGALATWIAYLLPYAMTGRASDFIGNYLLAPLAVSRGYSGSAWLSSPWYSLFVLGPMIMLMAGLLIVFSRTVNAGSTVGFLDASRNSSPTWTALMGLFVAATTAQASVLNRADASHLLNCYILFPVFLAMFTLWVLGGKGERDTRARVTLGIVIVILACFSINRGNPGFAAPSGIWTRLTTAAQGRLTDSTPSSHVAQGRVDAPLASESQAFLALSSLTLSDATELTAAIHQSAGTQPVYIDPSLSAAFGPYLGYWYFSSDAKPAEVPYEEDSLVLTEVQRQANLSALRDSSNPLCTLVTTEPESDESREALARIDAPVDEQVVIAGTLVHIYSCQDAAAVINPEETSP
jgi:hypothetical protein